MSKPNFQPISQLKQLLWDNRDRILAIAAAHGARNVRIFGSVARGEATPDSDIDFLHPFSN